MSSFRDLVPLHRAYCLSWHLQVINKYATKEMIMLSSIVYFKKINVIWTSQNWARGEVKRFWYLGSILLIEEAVRAGLAYSCKAHGTDLQGHGQDLMNAYRVPRTALAQNETPLFHLILMTTSPHKRGSER